MAELAVFVGQFSDVEIMLRGDGVALSVKAGSIKVEFLRFEECRFTGVGSVMLISHGSVHS